MKFDTGIEESYTIFNEYVQDYKNEGYILEYDEMIFVKDMLYGLGVSIDSSKYRFHQGFQQFLLELAEIIKKETRTYSKEDDGFVQLKLPLGDENETESNA